MAVVSCGRLVVTRHAMGPYLGHMLGLPAPVSLPIMCIGDPGQSERFGTDHP
jgi:hypothetical protein